MPWGLDTVLIATLIMRPRKRSDCISFYDSEMIGRVQYHGQRGWLVPNLADMNLEKTKFSEIAIAMSPSFTRG